MNAQRPSNCSECRLKRSLKHQLNRKSSRKQADVEAGGESCRSIKLSTCHSKPVPGRSGTRLSAAACTTTHAADDQSCIRPAPSYLIAPREPVDAARANVRRPGRGCTRPYRYCDRRGVDHGRRCWPLAQPLGRGKRRVQLPRRVVRRFVPALCAAGWYLLVSWITRCLGGERIIDRCTKLLFPGWFYLLLNVHSLADVQSERLLPSQH